MSRDSYDSGDSGLGNPARASNYQQLSTMTRRFAVMVLVSLAMWALIIWGLVAVVSAEEPSYPLVERCSVVVPEDLGR